MRLLPGRLRAGRGLGIVVGLVLALAAASPAVAQDASELLVRLNRIEGQMRQLSGQVEQLGHENRQLKDQLKRFQEDVEFRFQEQKGSGGRSAAPPTPAPRPERPQRRSDAFDSETSPAAPGAPKALGSTPAGRDGIAALIESDRPPSGAAAPRQVDLGPQAKGVAGLNPDFAKRSGAPATTGSAAASSQGGFETAYAAYTQRRYAEAESGFRDVIKAGPRDRRAGEATYWLGETYLRQNRTREAAEQFLKVTQEHARSPRAADAMLKLGVSLASLGAKDQACATFAELGRKYPSASAAVKQGTDREQKKARCAS
ncbi:tol-pal system protein YbgF [Enterovirga rhinocerotis]|nr:tol-pal system protein YbgF [Enterovirga rhinocerotis]